MLRLQHAPAPSSQQALMVCPQELSAQQAKRQALLDRRAAWVLLVMVCLQCVDVIAHESPLAPDAAYGWQPLSAVAWAAAAARTCLWLRAAGLWIVLRPLLWSASAGAALEVAAVVVAAASLWQIGRLALKAVPAAAVLLLARSFPAAAGGLYGRQMASTAIYTPANGYLAALTVAVLVCCGGRGAFSVRLPTFLRAVQRHRLWAFVPGFVVYVAVAYTLRAADKARVEWRRAYPEWEDDDDVSVARLWLRASFVGWYRWFSAAYLTITAASWAASWAQSWWRRRSQHSSAGGTRRRPTTAGQRIMLHLGTVIMTVAAVVVDALWRFSVAVLRPSAETDLPAVLATYWLRDYVR